MTLLITGGTGFVMSHLARLWLERDPTARAVVLDAAAADQAAERFFAPVRDRLTLVQGDVREAALLDRIAADHEVRWIVHGAAVTSVRRTTLADPDRPDISGARDALGINMLGSLELLGLACRLPALERFIYVSSGSVYGDHGPETPLPEEGFVHPDGLYDIGKYGSELLCRTAAADYGVPAVSVRFSGVYGPLDRETATRDVRCVPLRIASRALAGETIRVSSLDGVGDFIHARDVAEALIALLQGAPPRHPVYNIAQGQLVSLGQLIALAAKVLPEARCEEVAQEVADVVLDPAQSRGRWGAYDISRMTEEFGWRPRPIERAFPDYLDWLALDRLDREGATGRSR